MVWNSKKVTFINEQNWRNTVRAVAPVYSANQDLSLFLHFWSILEGVFSAEEKGSFKIDKLDDSVMEIAQMHPV